MRWIRQVSENNGSMYDIHTICERGGKSMMVNENITNMNEVYSKSYKEGKEMIYTGEFKMFGQLEEQADAGDIEAFVFRNGEVVPASQAENSTGPVIHTAPEKNYGRMEEVANGNSDVEAFVFRNGEVIPASQAENSTGPVVHTAPERNFALRLAVKNFDECTRMITA